MNSEDIRLSDWQRILFGNAPPIFSLEVLVRTLVMFLVLWMLIKLLGKRMSGQLTITEMSVMLTLGAIVALPMQTPDQGLVQGIFILGCTWVFQRGTNWLAFLYPRFERITQGRMSLLVKDGVLQLEEMKRTRVSREQIFAVLRSREIYQLGAVARVYLEACGVFSVFREAEARPGLSLFPEDDRESHKSRLIEARERRVCSSCGWSDDASVESRRCRVCEEQRWTGAVLEDDNHAA